VIQLKVDVTLTPGQAKALQSVLKATNDEVADRMTAGPAESIDAATQAMVGLGALRAAVARAIARAAVYGALNQHGVK